MYGTMYGTMDLVFPVMCIAVIAIVIFSFAKGMQEWNDNNKAPLLIVAAKVVGKRQNTVQHNQPNAGDMSGAHGYTVIMDTTYYVSFEIESGDTREFIVDWSKYNILSEGTEGNLSFKGTKFISFESKESKTDL